MPRREYGAMRVPVTSGSPPDSCSTGGVQVGTSRTCRLADQTDSRMQRRLSVPIHRGLPVPRVEACGLVFEGRSPHPARYLSRAPVRLSRTVLMNSFNTGTDSRPQLRVIRPRGDWKSPYGPLLTTLRLS